LIVRSIGEAAALEINGEGTGFRPRRQPDAGSPVAPNAPARTQGTDRSERASKAGPRQPMREAAE